MIGASIAYHLSLTGSGSILVLERNAFATASSSKAAGLVLQASTKYSNFLLSKKTVEIIPFLEEEIGEPLEYHKVGSVRLASSDDRLGELNTMVKNAEIYGISAKFLKCSEMRALVPWLRTTDIKKAAFFPTDGYLDPYRLTWHYIKAAKKNGVTFIPASNVTGVVVEKNIVNAVVVNDEKIGCGTVVDACGVWSAIFASKIGLTVPMAPVRSHYWIAKPDKHYGEEHAITVMPDISAYTRPELGGLILGLQEKQSATFDARTLPEDLQMFSPTIGEDHWDLLAEAYDDISKFFPKLCRAQFSSYIDGLSSYTPDGEIILGRIPGISGFLVAGGDCGHGIALSAGIGQTISELISNGKPQIDISKFKPDRFGSVNPFGKQFREMCAKARSSKSRKFTLKDVLEKI